MVGKNLKSLVVKSKKIFPEFSNKIASSNVYMLENRNRY
jgi:hypothetical protein